MVRSKAVRAAVVGLLGLGMSAGAQAVPLLEARNSGAVVFDPNTNLEWLANANLAVSMSFGLTVSSNVLPGPDEIGSTGRMSWTTAQAWIAAMNTANYLGGGWRLPITVQPDSSCSEQFDPGSPFPLQGSGLNCDGSELGGLFYNKLGGNATESVLNTTGDTVEEIANLLLFGGTQSGNTVTGSSIQSSVYWSGTEFAPNPDFAWFFSTFYGSQGAESKGYNPLVGYFAWAVRPGPAAVPEPTSLLLLGAGLAGLGWSRRRSTRRPG